MRKRIERTLIIDTDAYAGNFDRLMFAWIFGIGATDDEPSYIDEICEVAVRGLGPDGQRLVSFLETRNREHDGQVHQSFIDIFPTPGFWNDGYGHHFPNSKKVGWGLMRHPAYQSLGIFINKDLPCDLLRIVKERAKMFARLEWTSDMKKYQEKFKIRGFRLMVSTRTDWTRRI